MKRAWMKPLLPVLLIALAMPLHAADTDTAANAINALGIDLLAKTGKPGENALLSPYSIQNALAMTYAGAAGETREEMAKVLHFPKESVELNKSFAALNENIVALQLPGLVKDMTSKGTPPTPLTIEVANRLYGQEGYDFREAFLSVVKESYRAPLEQLDFKTAADKAAKLISDWVATQTHDRIKDLIPAGALTKETRLVLVNAIYLKASWAQGFDLKSTMPQSFHVNGGDEQNVPMMSHEARYGYAKKEGYMAIGIPYIGSDLQFLVLLPTEVDGLPALEAKLTPAMLSDCAKLETSRVNLHLPKFKLEPPLMQLSESLKALGMKTAFDDPRGSANFDGIAPRKPDDYLYISEVFHKTFLSVDENGTEAAAATAVVMMRMLSLDGGYEPVFVDRPFLFAIQDRKSGACLFLGRVTDPR